MRDLVMRGRVALVARAMITGCRRENRVRNSRAMLASPGGSRGAAYSALFQQVEYQSPGPPRRPERTRRGT